MASTSIADPRSLEPQSPGLQPGPQISNENYLNNAVGWKSWLLTLDHKRIAILYIVSISFFFFLGGLAASLVRFNLLEPQGLMGAEAYNRSFTAHGVIMIFFFLIPSIPAVHGNFLLPMMLGAKDVAFPKLNLLSWYCYIAGGIMALVAMLLGGVDTGWTFYTPYSSLYSNGAVVWVVLGAFMAGFSSILTGLNFIVTIHKMRAPGLTWFRLPLFCWSMYATSLIQLLGTPVVAITLVLVLVEKTFGVGIFDPKLGGDPVLFQHFFWFYSHPAVYIMILPGMAVVSEVITCFSRKTVFGYKFIAFSSLAIAVLGFLVWGHHLFVSSQSPYAGMVFSILSFLVAVPSAIKVFNWTATLYKGSIRLQTPMLYVLGFIGLFTIGGLTGLPLASLATDVHLHDTYYIIAHFHYIMVGGAVMAYLAGIHFWWPKMTGRMYPEAWGRTAAIVLFVGFNLTFLPQFFLGMWGMNRRYHSYAPEFQTLNVFSTLGATVQLIGYALPLFYLLWSLKYGAKAGNNPWGATGLEWQTPSPPPMTNFEKTPIVTTGPYAYNALETELAEERAQAAADELQMKILDEESGRKVDRNELV
jgi:cytochrome c oxidase subunit 1